MEVDFNDEKLAARARWVEEIIVKKNLLPNIDIPCRAYYFYVRALLAASPSIPIEDYEITMIHIMQEYLQKVVDCPDSISINNDASGDFVTTEMKRYAISLLSDLNFLLQYASTALPDP